MALFSVLLVDCCERTDLTTQYFFPVRLQHTGTLGYHGYVFPEPVVENAQNDKLKPHFVSNKVIMAESFDVKIQNRKFDLWWHFGFKKMCVCVCACACASV